MNQRTRSRALLLGTVLAASTAWLTLASPATAHVTVSDPDATRGGDGFLTFRVPNESDKAATTKIAVTIPSGVVFTEVSAQSKPGWKVDVREAKLPKPVKLDGTTITRAVHTVTWVATGDGIPTDQFDEFSIAAEPLPNARAIHFAVDQGYADGTVVRWNQHGTEDQVEHPAPTLELARSAPGTAGGPDWLTRGLAIAALAIALAGWFSSVRQDRQRATSA